MIDLRKLCKGTGFLIVESDDDTTNLICRYGHIYPDGLTLCAAANEQIPTGAYRRLRAVGKVIMDGDGTELTVRFAPSRFNEVCRILRPRQEGVRENSQTL